MVPSIEQLEQQLIGIQLQRAEHKERIEQLERVAGIVQAKLELLRAIEAESKDEE